MVNSVLGVAPASELLGNMFTAVITKGPHISSGCPASPQTHVNLLFLYTSVHTPSGQSPVGFGIRVPFCATPGILNSGMVMSGIIGKSILGIICEPILGSSIACARAIDAGPFVIPAYPAVQRLSALLIDTTQSVSREKADSLRNTGLR